MCLGVDCCNCNEPFEWDIGNVFDDDDPTLPMEQKTLTAVTTTYTVDQLSTTTTTTNNNTTMMNASIETESKYIHTIPVLHQSILQFDSTISTNYKGNAQTAANTENSLSETLSLLPPNLMNEYSQSAFHQVEHEKKENSAKSSLLALPVVPQQHSSTILQGKNHDVVEAQMCWMRNNNTPLDEFMQQQNQENSASPNDGMPWTTVKCGYNNQELPFHFPTTQIGPIRLTDDYEEKQPVLPPSKAAAATPPPQPASLAGSTEAKKDAAPRFSSDVSSTSSSSLSSAPSPSKSTLDQKSKQLQNQQQQSPIKLLRPLSAYNYFFRDERDWIVLLGADTPPTERDFSNEKLQRILHKRWYQDPLKKKRSHKRTHGLISFQDLSRVIARRWKKLSAEGIEFYETAASLDLQRFQREKVIQLQQKHSTSSSTP